MERLQNWWICSPKKERRNEAHMLAGRETDTQDIWGNTLKESGVCISPEKVRTALFSFVGEYNQIPPMYSALKMNGNKTFTEMLYNEYNRDIPIMSQNRMYRVYNYKGRFCAVYEMTDEGLKIKYNFM